MRRAAALPIATVDCFQKNGEIVCRSGNFLPGLTACGTEGMTQGLESPPAKNLRRRRFLENLVGVVRSTRLSNCPYRIEQPLSDAQETAERLVSLNWTNQPIQCLQAACSRTGTGSSPLPVRCTTAAQGS